ncbi:U32 family peptidase [Patescibacteria group bacterium]|nr:U32 family peptidase [Patescibacteria group bacterium]
MIKTQISIPCHWDKKIIEEIVKQNLLAKDIQVTEVYGTLARGPVGHGRSPSSVPDISKKEAVNFRKFIGALGMKFIYLLNAPFEFKSALEKKEVEIYLDWIINDFKADALMITSHELMRFVKKNYPKTKIYISTVAGVLSWKHLEKFLDIAPERIVPHHDVNRNFKDLKELVDKTGKLKIELELMVTESCLRGCPYREAHYKHLGGGNADAPFHTVCNTKKMNYPLEFLKSNFIRPEDLNIYEVAGVNIFKITGRSKPANWLPEVTKAYLERSYKGNLVRLFGIDPSLKAEEWIYINNKALQGFLEKFPRTGIKKDENAYCDKWIYKLHKENDFKIDDGSKYDFDKEGNFCCYCYGNKVASIIKKEK